MRLLSLLQILLLPFLCLLPHVIQAQIPTKVFEITNILVDGCAGSLEGQNEMVRFQVGPNAINVNNLRVDGAGSTGVITSNVWPNTTNIWRGIATPPAKPVEVASINSTIINCGYLIEPIGGIIPAGKQVLLITSTDFDPTAHSFATLGDTLYVIFQVAGNTAGHFVNYNAASSERTLVLVNTPTGGSDTVAYDRSLLSGAVDGASVKFTWPGVASYYNNGCQAPYIAPSAAWTLPSPICQSGAPIDLNTLVTGTIGGTWSGAGVTGSIFNPAGLMGNISITYTVGNAPCQIDSTQSIIVQASPTVTVNSASICSGTSATLTASPSVSGGTYLWSNGANTASITVSPVATTAYTVTYTLSGCIGTASATVTVGSSVSITAAASPATICPGASTTITASGGATYVWSPGGSGSSFSANPAATTTYSVTGTTTSGCTGSATVSVIVSSTAAISVTASPASVCLGASSTLTAAGGVSYIWNTTASANPLTVSPAATTTYSVTGTVAPGCSGTATVSVTVNPLPVINATASPSTICSGANSTISALGATTYTWSPGGSGPSFTATPTSTTIYSVTGTTTAGCTGSSTVSLSVNPSPAVAVTATPALVCPGDSSTITATGADSYIWSPVGAGVSFTAYPASSTTYSVTGTNISGCTGTALISVTVNQLPPVAVTASPASICDGESSTITASGANSYVWSPVGAGISFTVSPTVATIYSVTGTDANGCTATADILLTVNPVPVAAFTGDPLTGCDPTTVNFTDQSTGNISNWDWDFGDGNLSGLQNPSHTYGSGTFSVTLTTSSDAGCQSSITMSNYISVPANPQAAFFANPPIAFEDNPLIQFIDQSSGAATYYWSFGDAAGGTSNIQNPAYTFAGTGEFVVSLVVENATGCFDSTSMVVFIRPTFTFYLPNSFSPNGDVHNELFSPYGVGWNTDYYSMRIYSRWGDLVFSTTDINLGWNGTMPDGGDAEQGVYSVRVFIKGPDGNDRVYFGAVNLLR